MSPRLKSLGRLAMAVTLLILGLAPTSPAACAIPCNCHSDNQCADGWHCDLAAVCEPAGPLKIYKGICRRSGLTCCDAGAYATSSYYVTAASCSEATTQYRSLAMPEAQAVCNPEFVCGTQVPPCYYSGEAYVIDGPMFFGCTYTC